LKYAEHYLTLVPVVGGEDESCVEGGACNEELELHIQSIEPRRKKPNEMLVSKVRADTGTITCDFRFPSETCFNIRTNRFITEVETPMHHVPKELRGAVTGFVILLCKGLIEDKRWNWDLDHCDWKRYQSGFLDPSALKITLAVFLNSLEMNEAGVVINYEDARFRGFQYFRAQVDPSYPIRAVEPPFQPHEIEEPDWRIWEA
jgi:hypothetical protein